MHTLGHTIRVCEGGEGEGDKVVGMQLHVSKAYICHHQSSQPMPKRF